MSFLKHRSAGVRDGFALGGPLADRDRALNAGARVGFAAALVLWSGAAVAATVMLGADRDNTIFEDDTSRSNGSGPYLFAGNTGRGPEFTRRGLIAFDLSGIPSGAQILSATLTLNVSRTPFARDDPVDFSAHRLLTDWGEAGSNSGGSEAFGGGGAGAPAQPGDATWTSNFFGTSSWAAPGGDFAAVASAMTAVGPPGPYQWSGPGIVADVQAWVGEATTNFGWLIRAAETGSATARRFMSREFTEDPALRPMLEVSYEAAVVPLPAAAFLFAPAVLGLAAWARSPDRGRPGST